MKYIFYFILLIIIILVVFLFYKNTQLIEQEVVNKKRELTVKNKEDKTIEKKSELTASESTTERKIHDKNPYVQAEAIAALELKGGEESIEQLEGMFHSPSPSVIMSAVAAIGRLEAKDAINKLENLYQDSMIRVDGYGQSIRTEIIDALGNIRDEKAVDFLGQEFNAKESLMYKEHLLKAHKKIGSKKSIPYLEAYLKFIEEHPVKDFPALKFLVDKAKEETRQIIEEIKDKK